MAYQVKFTVICQVIGQHFYWYKANSISDELLVCICLGCKLVWKQNSVSEQRVVDGRSISCYFGSPKWDWGISAQLMTSQSHVSSPFEHVVVVWDIFNQALKQQINPRGEQWMGPGAGVRFAFLIIQLMGSPSFKNEAFVLIGEVSEGS